MTSFSGQRKKSIALTSKKRILEKLESHRLLPRDALIDDSFKADGDSHECRGRRIERDQAVESLFAVNDRNEHERPFRHLVDMGVTTDRVRRD